jgi:hypothetical protein
MFRGIMTHEFEDYDDFVNDDNLLRDKKKKVNGKRKGNRTELELTKILNKRFGTQDFSRSIGSGNRWSQAHLPEHAREVFSGDLIVPKNFKFALESKGGYDGIDINSIFLKGSNELDGFLDQALKDAKRCNRKPMMCWKRKRKPWLVGILTQDLKDEFKYQLKYGKWSILALEELLKLDDEFFLDHSKSDNS